jgi:long-chain acyl-CoA synthetase
MTFTTPSYAQDMLKELNKHGYVNLTQIFEESCDKHAGQTAFSCLGSNLTFSDLERLSRNFAAFLLHDCGLIPGDRVAIQLPNINQYPVVAWAALRAGLILVNTNPLYTKRELIHQFTDSGAKLLVVLADLLPSTAPAIAESDISQVVVTHIGDFEQAKPLPQVDLENVIDLADALQRGDGYPLPEIKVAMEDIAVLQYTGGTTGVAKGAMLTQANIFASAIQTSMAMTPEPGVSEIIIAPMPLYHIYGFTWNIVSSCLRGAVSILIPNPRDIDGLVDTMKSCKFTSMAGVNTLFAGLLQHPRFDEIDFSELLGSIAGGAALVSSIASEWERRTDSKIYEGYALSETASALSCNTPDDNQLGTVGKPLSWMEVKVVDTEGCDLGEGAEGELLIRGPQVLAGYWRRPEATAEAIDADGWFRTGDVAIIQGDGFIRIVDRIKDMILVSGFNVYPNEIEDVVSGHPGILECAVVGVADERTSEAVKVFAVKSDASITDWQIKDYCREHLTAYKVPRHVEFMEELPKSNVGKILRRELRA